MNPTFNSILAWPNLCNAWERMADNRGAPGPDQVSVRRFARHWEANLRRLQALVQAGRYRPGGLRRVAIPKRRGGQRLLSIANIGDRVLQRAALNVLDPHLDRAFLPCSFGYRSGRGLHQAVAAIVQLRNQGYRWVVDADIDECFDSLDHQQLRRFLAEQVDDPRTMALLQLWLIAGRRHAQPPRGVAQGLPISPLFCNLYLHQLDCALAKRNRKLVRYADDFIVCCRSREHAERVYGEIDTILARLRLRFEPSKSRITSFDEGFDFLGVHFTPVSYSFNWQNAEGETEPISVVGPTPAWVWGRLPRGYQ